MQWALSRPLAATMPGCAPPLPSIFTPIHLLIAGTTSLRLFGTAPWAAELKLLRAEKALEVEFNTGERFRYPAELLRAESPAAVALTDAQGRPKLVHGRRHVGIINVEPVGRYAVRVQFDDMHGSGLFSWPFLYELGMHKRQRMRAYITRLKELGLSRDPRRSPAAGRGGRSMTAAQQPAAAAAQTRPDR